MAVEALIARMAVDAHARIAELQAMADAEVAAIERSRAQAALHDQSAVMTERQAVRDQRHAEERALAQREAAAQRLAAQHALVERAFTRALALAAAEQRVIASLPALVQELARHLDGQRATLRCRPAIAPALQRAAQGLVKATLSTDSSLPPGFIATTQDGRCTIDATLPAQLAALRPLLQAGLLARATEAAS